mmetsp:Transcript_98799/g.285126  ORF Transcript_98799/g.285126 Transcript_98799/m.285126 type:complete len:256 (-) Transcript_98799:140-907(-)
MRAKRAASSEVFFHAEDLLARLGGRRGGARLRVLHLLEVRLVRQRGHLRPLEGARRVESLRVPEGREQLIADVLHISAHVLAADSEEVGRKRLADELFLRLHGGAHDALGDVLGEPVLEHAVEQCGEVRMHALVPRDALVCEAEAGHHPTLLQREDRAVCAATEDGLDASERQEPLREAELGVEVGRGPRHPLVHCGHRAGRLHEAVPLLLLPDQLPHDASDGLGVDALHCDLEAVETPSLRALDLRRHAARRVR